MVYLHILFIALHTRHALSASTHVSSTSDDWQIKYFESSTVADEFSFVTEQVIKLFQSHDPNVLVEELEALMAGDKHDIKFLSDDQVKQLREYSSTQLLLHELSHLWSWSNHSMLRVLVGPCDKAIKLLDEFDCHLDPFQPIKSYPMFEIMPPNATTHTTLSVKYNKCILTLQDVIDICSHVMNKCAITHYCPQVLATEHTQNFSTIYWSIPKCIMNLVIRKALEHSSDFCDMGIVEVVMYPDTHIITGKVTDLYVS